MLTLETPFQYLSPQSIMTGHMVSPSHLISIEKGAEVILLFLWVESSMGALQAYGVPLIVTKKLPLLWPAFSYCQAHVKVYGQQIYFWRN